MRTRRGRFPDGAEYTELIDDNGKSISVSMGKHTLKDMMRSLEWSRKVKTTSIADNSLNILK